MKKSINEFPTLKEIKRAHEWKRDYEKYLPLSRFVFRPVGFLLTWLTIRMGLTTENVSWLSGIVGIAGCLFLVIGLDHLLPIGIALLLFFNLLDCVDGSIARATKTQNPYGRFLDSICGGIVYQSFWGIIGILAFIHSNLTIFSKPFGYNQIFWLLIGFAACFLNIFMGYLENTFDHLLRDDWNKIQASMKEAIVNVKEKTQINSNFNEDNRRGKRYVLGIISTNLRVQETHYFLLIVAYLMEAIDFLLTFYFLFYLFQNIFLFAVYSMRGQRIRKLYP